MQKIKLEAENDLEKRCKNLKEQNKALISGLDLANETISNHHSSYNHCNH